MSPEHVAALNTRLAASQAVATACASLSRDYALAFRLTTPDGALVHWVLTFSPTDGMAVSREAPGTADVTLVGARHAVMRATRDHAEMPVTYEGDMETLMATVGHAFAAGQATATVPVTWPDEV